MIKIGNIYSECELINHKKLDYINYGKLIDSFGEKGKENDLPSLIIGWKLLKNISPHQNILEKRFEWNQPVFWEFSPDEDIIQYTNGLDKFIKDAPTLFISRFKYINADPFNYKVYTPADLENKLLKLKNGKLYVYKNDMAYYWIEDKIYGFKLPIYDQILGQNVTLQHLKSITTNSIIDDGEYFQKFYKIFPEFQLLKRSMVVFAFS